MNKQNKTIIGSAILVVILVAIVAFVDTGKTEPGKYDDFAKCLSEKGAVMYGAASCSHCLENKKAFGDSFKYINYVECPENISACIDVGIGAYPTWLVGTSTKIVGFEGNSTFEELAKATGCELPK